MSHPEEYDVVVLGSGRARFFAWSLASQGKRVAVVERRSVQSTCSHCERDAPEIYSILSTTRKRALPLSMRL